MNNNNIKMGGDLNTVNAVSCSGKGRILAPIRSYQMRQPKGEVEEGYLTY